jgi:hypothetical protein
LHAGWPGLGWQVGWAGKLARLAGLAGMDGWLGGKTFGFDYYYYYYYYYY